MLFADDDEERARLRDWEPQEAPGGLTCWSRRSGTASPSWRDRAPAVAAAAPPAPGGSEGVRVRGGSGRAGLGRPPARAAHAVQLAARRDEPPLHLRGNLDDVKAIKNELGGTVNDVILTVVARALRRHLQSRGERVDGLTMKAFVPVSMRSRRGPRRREARQPGGRHHRAAADRLLDPEHCLAQISEAMGGLKKSGQPVGAQALTELTGFAPPNLVDQAVRLPIPQRFVNLVVTNVPGPQFELTMGSKRLLDIFRWCRSATT